MTPVQEFFNKGLVNVRDASLLASGELQQCDNCVYRPFDPAIQGAPGRQAVHSSAFSAGTTAIPQSFDPTNPDTYAQAAGKIKGLAWLSADAAKDQLLVYNGPNLYISDFTGITGLTWTQLQGVGSLSDRGDEKMVVVKYDTAYYILNGVDKSRRVGFVTPAEKIVTTATISGSVTVTSTEPAIFTSIVIGQHVTGTGVPANTYVTAKNYTIASGVYTVTSLTLSNTSTHGAVTLTFTSDTLISSRVMGMMPTGTMQYAVTVGTGAWPNSGDYGGDGFYWVFYTEAFIPGEIDDYSSGFVESAATVKDLDLKRFQISAHASQGITIRRNDNVMNDGGTEKVAATHWIVYMSPMSPDPLIIPPRNLFVRIGGPVPISVVSTPFTTTATDTGWMFGTDTADASGYDTVSNRGGVLAPGGAYAAFNDDDEAMFVKTFLIPTSALAVTGIELELSMAYNGFGHGDGNGLAVYLQRVNSSGTVTKSSTSVPPSRIYGHPGGWKTFNYGGAFDTFNPSPSAWLGTDFFDDGSGTFRIFITCFWWDAYLDYIKIKVHYNGFSPGQIGAFYKTITYQSQVGTSIIDSTALPPPSGASTGAVFRGQLVLNSRVARNGIFYSKAGFPEYFPKPYFMTFDSPKKDIVTNIKRIGSMLVVGLQDNIQRVNYLPTELDTDGQGGLIFEPIATDHGICGPLAAVVVDIPNLGTVLVYASFKGIHYTDGIRPRFLNTDLNWLKTVKATTLSNVELIVYPAMN